MILTVDAVGDGLTAPFIQLGAIGVLCLFLLWQTRKLFDQINTQHEATRKALADQIEYEQARADKLQERLEQNNRELVDKVVPALIEATRTTNQLLMVLERERR